MTDEADLDNLRVEGYRDYLKVLARTQWGSTPCGRLDCSDVVQMTLLEAVRKRDQFRGRSAAEMAGWLRKMLAFNMVDAARAAGRAKRGALHVVSLEDALDQSSARLGTLLATDQSTPSQAAGRHEDAVRLARVLEKLPQAQREAVVLRHCQGCSLEEISQKLDRTPAAVGGLLRRGLRELRVLLEERE
jgi:RNA polymerase sigma-70 factor (ECF subfamily)